MIKQFVALAAAVMLSGCVTATSQFEKEMPVGTVVSKQFSTPQGDVLLPPGDWTIVGKSISRNNMYHPFGETALAQIDDQNKLRGFIFLVNALETHGGGGFKATGECDAKEGDIYVEKTANQHLGTQGCVKVFERHLSFRNAGSGYLVHAENYLDTHDVKKPTSMLFSRYRIVRGGKFLTATYGFDYRQSPRNMIPDFTPSEQFTYQRPFGTDTWKTNLETVIAWSREKEDLIRSTYLD